MNRLKPFLWGSVILAAIAAITLYWLPPARLIETADLLAGIGNPDDMTAIPGENRETVRIDNSQRPGHGDIYMTGSAPEAAIILVPGASPQGRRDRRIVAFARTLAEARFLVLVPDLAGDDPVRLSADDSDAIAGAIHYLSRRFELDRLGVAAISYAAGPALIAASRPEIAGKIGFLLVIGGYYDMTAAITYLTTGSYWDPDAQHWRSGPVDRRAKWRFLLANADRIGARDGRLLRDLARARLQAPDASPEFPSAALSPAGQAVLSLMTNDNPEKVEALIDRLPPQLRDQFYSLDLAARDLSTIRARTILIHGCDDPLVPYTQSLALQNALPHGQVDRFLIDRLVHVDLGRPGLTDIWSIYRAIWHLLAARDAASRPKIPSR